MPYVPKTKPMKHQTLAIEAAYRAPAHPCASDSFAYLMDMGTGKSKVILDEWGAGEMNGGPKDLLVVAPAGSYRNWFQDKSELQRAEINVHLSEDLRDRMVVNHWRSGSGKAHRDSLAEFLRVRDRPRALFVNIEALSSVEACRELITEYLGQDHSYFAIDESTTIKNPGSIRTEWLTHLAEMADVRRIATGLLTPRSPLDAWAQFNFLDWRILGRQNYYAFRARYAVTKKVELKHGPQAGRAVKLTVGYRNVEEIQQRIAPYSFRVLKEDCLDLQPKVFMTRDVAHTKEQARIYADLRDKAHAMITSDAYVTVDMILQMFIRLHQVNLGFVVDEDGNIHDIPEKRTDEIIKIVDEASKKVIIWTPFQHRIRSLNEKLKKEFGEKSVALFYGANRGTRYEDEKRFLGDPECKIIIASQPSGMRGNTWLPGTTVIYDSNTFDLEQRQQSEDRPHRKGQTDRVTYFDLLTENTIDYRFVHAMRNKYDMATTITGEKARDWI
jgi:SNF2 family DNA or RNA helicase